MKWNDESSHLMQLAEMDNTTKYSGSYRKIKKGLIVLK